MKSAMMLLFGLVLAVPALAAETGHDHPSQYAGQETRAIKALSAEDIAELERGGGWGLARPAELNGVPGPAHLLEMADDIDLDADQRAAIQALFDDMNAKARKLGADLIAAEQSPVAVSIN